MVTTETVRTHYFAREGAATMPPADNQRCGTHVTLMTAVEYPELHLKATTRDGGPPCTTVAADPNWRLQYKWIQAGSLQLLYSSLPHHTTITDQHTRPEGHLKHHDWSAMKVVQCFRRLTQPGCHHGDQPAISL
jgi:hypothetical protein